MITITRCCLVMLCGSILFSCSKDRCFELGMTGEWVWEKSVGGWGTFFPETESEQRILRINQNTYREYVGGELHFESAYKIIEADDRLYGSPRTLEVIDEGLYILTFTNDNLILDESYNPDAPIHYYKRQ